jgi:hypothetical protein
MDSADKPRRDDSDENSDNYVMPRFMRGIHASPGSDAE